MKQEYPRIAGTSLCVTDIVAHYNMGRLEGGDVFEFIHKEGGR